MAQIAALRAQSMSTLEETNQIDTRLEDLTTETRVMLQELKERIRQMENTPSKHDVQLRNNRVRIFYFVLGLRPF